MSFISRLYFCIKSTVVNNIALSATSQPLSSNEQNYLPRCTSVPLHVRHQSRRYTSTPIQFNHICHSWYLVHTLVQPPHSYDAQTASLAYLKSVHSMRHINPLHPRKIQDIKDFIPTIPTKPHTETHRPIVDPTALTSHHRKILPIIPALVIRISVKWWHISFANHFHFCPEAFLA